MWCFWFEALGLGFFYSIRFVVQPIHLKFSFGFDYTIRSVVEKIR